MGQSASVESIVNLAKQKTPFLPPLGARNPVSGGGDSDSLLRSASQTDTDELSQSNPLCFFDISANGTAIGRVVMEIKQDVTPKTAENFIQLCQRSPGQGFKASKVSRYLI